MYFSGIVYSDLMEQELDKSYNLVSEIKLLIEQSKHQVSVTVNASITLLYWQVGN